MNAAKGIISDEQSEMAVDGSLESRYWISEESRVPISLSRLLQSTEKDPAFKVSLDV